MDLAWYCARTKPKHEHIAAANIRKYLGLEVFQPQLKVERSTRRGRVRCVEPLFPCYIFIRCAIARHLDAVRYSNGVTNVVHFADRFPSIADSVIQELKACFDTAELMVVEEKLLPGDEVRLEEGAFSGMQASVLRVMPAGRRVQILLEILGRPTAVEVDRCLLTLEKNSLADLVPLLAAPQSVPLEV